MEVVLSQLELASPRRAPSGHKARVSKKCRQLHESALFSKRSNQHHSRPRGKCLTKVPCTTTNALHSLRDQVASMTNELESLRAKWAKHIPNKRILVAAHRSAYEKYATSVAEHVHRDLQQQLRQQQLVFATLQTAILNAPMRSNSQDMFEALHFATHLGHGDDEREAMLCAHHAQSVATVPSIAYKFFNLANNQVLAHQSAHADETPVSPLAHMEITGCHDGTLVSSLFIFEIPHTSLEDVYAAVLAYFDAIPTSMKKHFGVHTKRTRLNRPDSPVIYRRSSFQGHGLPMIVNNIVSTELTASHGMVHIDAVTDDALYPVTGTAASRFGICGLVLTPRREQVTRKLVAVTLRWMVVYRYKMVPCDPAIEEEIKNIRPLLNGDLLTASVCSYLKQQKHA